MEIENRISPEKLLQQIDQEEAKQGRGHLKIFFGYAAGVGKTYAMLKAAHAAKRRGIDVRVGYVEPHVRPETIELLNGLELLPTHTVSHEGIQLQEFDLDRALALKPQLLLVDELAHTNAPGSRHHKRYQDIDELLRHGIDVYTTINVQHIESLNDIVASITGVTVAERIPDTVFDSADQVKLIDIEPQELIERMKEGKIYKKGQAKHALGNFFTLQNLVALREIALRRCADRLNHWAEMSTGNLGSGLTDEHILVCLSSSPSNSKIIRTAARLASAFRGGFTALFVETPHFATMDERDRERLRQNTRLAEQLGAVIETTYGEDIAYQIGEFARLSGVSKIVVGRSSTQRKLLFGKPALTERIAQSAPNLDVYIIPDSMITSYVEKKKNIVREEWNLKDLVNTFILLMIATGLGFVFYEMGVREANIVMVYILMVLVTAMMTNNRWCSLISSLISVLLFNFCFTIPRFSLQADDPGYIITFPIMLLVAFIASSFTVKIKQQAKQSAQTAYRTKILFDTSRQLENAKDNTGIISATCDQLKKLLGRDIVFYRGEKGQLALPQWFPVHEGENQDTYINDNEYAVANWVYINHKRAGATTDTLSSAKLLYLSIRIGQEAFGVIGIAIGTKPLESFENSIMLSILGECALRLKNDQIAREKEEATLLAKSEQLRSNLLRSISHDLRTPLTSIFGNAEILLSDEKGIPQEKRLKLYGNIYEDSLWLINLVENLLSITRIENGTMQLRQTTELLSEVIWEALKHVDRRVSEHHLTVKPTEEFILVKIDVKLIMQVIINLVDNAIKYTPKESEIIIEARKEGDEVCLTIADNGGGITEEGKKHIFDMFYTQNTQSADSRRSLGLGLALCKSIIEAHNGTISVADNKPHGAVFTIWLKTEEVVLHE